MKESVSDIAPEYSGVQDGSAVTTMPYVSLDITDKEVVEKFSQNRNQMLLFIVQHGQQ